MTMLRRSLILICLSLLPAASPSAAQDYPSRPVRVIVPFGAGGPTDVFTRAISDELRKSLTQPPPDYESPSPSQPYGITPPPAAAKSTTPETALQTQPGQPTRARSCR